MANVRTVDLKELAGIIKAEPERQQKEIIQATRMGLLRSIPMMAERSPVDTGAYASSWDLSETEKSIILGNFAPHASIIEFGARPFTPPIVPLLQWAKRVLKDPSQPPYYSPEVRALAYGTRAKIQDEGMKPRRVLEYAIPDIIKNIEKEFKKIE